MTRHFSRRELFRLGSWVTTSAAALAPRAVTAAELPIGSPLIGHDAVVDGEVIEDRVFEGVAVGVRVWANHVTIRRCTMRRLVSDGENGTGVIVRHDTVGTRIVEIEVDGRDSISDGAGIALWNGSHGVHIVDSYIHHMQRVGISIGSTTYVDFPVALPEQSEHYIARNVIEYCGTFGRSGDAGSGIAMVGQSHRNTIRDNRVRRNRGHGIVLSGSVRGNGAPGTPAFDESPTWNVLADNIVEYNGEEGIRNAGANYTWIRDNFCYANGGLPIHVVSLGGTSDSRGVELIGNREVS
jgi:parallel beta-helix repeat protein